MILQKNNMYTNARIHHAFLESILILVYIVNRPIALISHQGGHHISFLQVHKRSTELYDYSKT
uniref:Uncharacterized protein n=1 Tax=Rhizophora mucronata TaxID=61149 RepID=A0A2P2IJC8_RHIMU